jgi:hypothetical protein
MGVILKPIIVTCFLLYAIFLTGMATLNYKKVPKPDRRKLIGLAILMLLIAIYIVNLLFFPPTVTTATLFLFTYCIANLMLSASMFAFIQPKFIKVISYITSIILAIGTCLLLFCIYFFPTLLQ